MLLCAVCVCVCVDCNALSCALCDDTEHNDRVRAPMVTKMMMMMLNNAIVMDGCFDVEHVVERRGSIVVRHYQLHCRATFTCI